MKNSRITIRGEYGDNEIINVEVIQTIFIGEGSVDYENKVIFKGSEKVQDEQIDLDAISDEEFEQFEETAENYFKSKYCTNNEELHYIVD